MSSVYFLVMHKPADPAHDFGFVKVGVTDGDVATRIAGLQTGNPHDLCCIEAFETPCARKVEHYMHRSHAARMHNREWLSHPRSEIFTLVEEAKDAARRFEEIQSREDVVRSIESNGKERRATPEEM